MNRVPDNSLPAKTPLVSVALCTFNGAAYLREQLDSVLGQTYPNLQLVISDDGSTDDTVKLIREYALTDNRIKYSINTQNLGYNRNFEKAFGLCDAEYIAPCDQDDIWELNKIGDMMKQWPSKALFIYSLSGSFTGTDFKNKKPAPDVRYTDIKDVHQLVFNSPVHGHACLFRRSLLETCKPFPGDIFYDWWMSMHAAAAGTIGCVPKTLTWHRVHENNSSRNIMRIKERDQRNEQLRHQSVYFLETFCSRGVLNDPQKSSLLEYARLLRTLDGTHFSWPMFRYVFRNRRRVFHYKKQKIFLIFSQLKHAFRMGTKGLL